MQKQVNEIVNNWCRRYAVDRADVDNAMRRVESCDWSEFRGELAYVNWKRDHELLSAIACELIKDTRRGKATPNENTNDRRV